MLLVDIDNVSKKYCRNQKRSMLYGLTDISRDILNLPVNSAKLRPDEFWVLKDISVQLRRGEVLGILGANGAGKSTMLKLISGIVSPDAGTIRTRGRVGELIEIGAGFHPMLTGRENIRIKAAILGMSRKEVDESFDSIVEFSELADFIDTPVKYYSSGMYMRLGFSVIVHSRPDLLLIDEALSVGDASFRAKCFNRMNSLRAESGIIFVSHSMGHIARICSHVLVLNKSGCIYYGEDVVKGIDHYYDQCSTDNALSVSGSGRAVIEKTALVSGRGKGIQNLHSASDDFILDLDMAVNADVANFVLIITITNHEQQNLIQANSLFDGVIFENTSIRHLRVNMGQLHLNPGVYGVTVSLLSQDLGEILARYENCLFFRMTGERIGYGSMQLPAAWECRT